MCLRACKDMYVTEYKYVIAVIGVNWFLHVDRRGLQVQGSYQNPSTCITLFKKTLPLHLILAYYTAPKIIQTLRDYLLAVYAWWCEFHLLVLISKLLAIWVFRGGDSVGFSFSPFQLFSTQTTISSPPLQIMPTTSSSVHSPMFEWWVHKHNSSYELTWQKKLKDH